MAVNHRRRRAALGALVGTAALVLAACGSSSGPPASSGAVPADTVRIGVEGPMTGSQSSTGIDMWRGAELFASRVNSSGGVLGKRIQLVQIDDRADAKAAAATARAAVAKGIAALIGPYNSAVGIDNLPVYLRAHVVVVRLTSNHKTNGMGITVQPMDYQVAPIEAAAVEKTAGHPSVAIVYDTSAYTSGVAEQMKSLLAAAGTSVVGFEPITAGKGDFTAVMTRIKAASPGLVYYSAYDPEAEQLVQEAHTLGVPGICLVDGLAAQGPTFLKTVPTDLARKCVFSGVPTAVQLPDASSYVSAYRAAYHEDPGTWGAFSYDSLGVLVSTVESVHSWAPSKADPALLHVAGYPGITGTITIDPATGNRQNPPIVMQTVGGTGEYVVSPEWQQTGGLPVAPGL